jgi:hypothetical protein
MALHFQDSLMTATKFHKITVINLLSMHELITGLTSYIIILNSTISSLYMNTYFFKYSVLG